MDYSDWLEETKSWTETDWRIYNEAYQTGRWHSVLYVIALLGIVCLIKCLFKIV